MQHRAHAIHRSRREHGLFARLLAPSGLLGPRRATPRRAGHIPLGFGKRTDTVVATTGKRRSAYRRLRPFLRRRLHASAPASGTPVEAAPGHKAETDADRGG